MKWYFIVIVLGSFGEVRDVEQVVVGSHAACLEAKAIIHKAAVGPDTVVRTSACMEYTLERESRVAGGLRR